MDRINVLMISTKEDVKNKVEKAKKLLNLKKISFDLNIFSNVELNMKKENVHVLNLSKNDLVNSALSTCSENVLIIDLDYSEKTIEKVINSLDNIENYDIINYKNKTSKVKEFFNKVLMYFYNLIFTFCGLQKMLYINSDFQFLSKKIINIINNTSKSPNYLRKFDNFIGYNIKTVELDKEKIKTKKDYKPLILALLFLSLVIISLIVCVYVCIKFYTRFDILKIIFAGIVVFIVLNFGALSSLTYFNYVNKI